MDENSWQRGVALFFRVDKEDLEELMEYLNKEVQ